MKRGSSEGQGVDPAQVQAQPFGVVQQDGPALAGIEQHPPARRFDQKGDSVLAPERRASAGGVIHHTMDVHQPLRPVTRHRFRQR